jgi:hypothetical protein
MDIALDDLPADRLGVLFERFEAEKKRRTDENQLAHYVPCPSSEILRQEAS